MLVLNRLRLYFDVYDLDPRNGGVRGRQDAIRGLRFRFDFCVACLLNEGFVVGGRRSSFALVFLFLVGVFLSFFRLSFASVDRKVNDERFLDGPFRRYYSNHFNRRLRLVRVLLNLALVLYLDGRAGWSNDFGLYFEGCGFFRLSVGLGGFTAGVAGGRSRH